METNFRLNKTAFEVLSFEDANKKISRFHEYVWKDRLIVANRLIAVAYNFPIDNPPKMDKTFFEIHQQNG